ncbi:hypothetical protein Tco_0784505 [Tanacetum coccineum]
MTIAEYLEYEKKVNHISNTKSYLPTYFGKSTPTPDPIQEFAHYFDPNQPGTKSDCDSEDMEEEDDDSEEDQEEDGDDGDTFDMWDITVEDVERIRKIFNVPDEIDEIVQPLIPEPIHTTPPNDDYVVPATKSILDEVLENSETRS